jgi:dTDP-glucose 4,6-dehydratase
LSEGHDVLVVDNFYTSSRENISHLLGNPKFEIIRHDVTAPLAVEVDAIYHLACPASPVHYQRFPVQTIKTSILGSLNMLELANKLQIPILLSSTSEVYGDPQISPQVEEYWGNVNPVGPRGVYDEAKRFQEAITMAYHTFHQVETRIVRIFNTYGPRMRLNDGRALPAFIGQALRGEDLTVFGDGTQTRSFCYVDDLVEGIYRLLMSDYAQPVNIGNPDEISLLDFAQEILQLTGANQKIVFKPLPVDDPKQRRPDISKAQSILGWQPTVDRAEGLAKTYDYFKGLSREELDKQPLNFKK